MGCQLELLWGGIKDRYTIIGRLDFFKRRCSHARVGIVDFILRPFCSDLPISIQKRRLGLPQYSHMLTLYKYLVCVADLLPTMSFRISTTLVRAVPVARHTALRIRAFHSPFTALGDSPLTSPTKDNTISSAYEKNYDHPSEPVYHSGLRTYVVSEPDAHSRHYQVPAGAYPTLAPYVKTTSPPTADPLAHDTTTADPPRDPSGVGENTAFRNASAPGTLGVRGGGYGGLDKQGAAPGTERLADRTLSDGSAAEKYAKTGGS